MKAGQIVFDKDTGKQNTVVRANKNGTVRVQFWGGRFGDQLLECTVKASALTTERPKQ